MRQLERERKEVWIAPYEGKTQRVDAHGRLTGVYDVTYGKPVCYHPTLSPCSGNVISDGFGLGEDYDRTMIVDKIGLPIDEASVVWVDVIPELNDDGTLKLGDDMLPTVPWDYVVGKVAESYSFTNVAIKKVE